MASLLTLLPDPQRAGVYQTDFAAEEIIAAAKTVDFHVFKFDLGRVHGKSALLEAFAKTLRFPDHFGKNWDALNDCLTDLSWLDGIGWVLILANGKTLAEGRQEVFHAALEILSSAAEHWRERKNPFGVFIQAQADWHCALPKIVGE